MESLTLEKDPPETEQASGQGTTNRFQQQPSSQPYVAAGVSAPGPSPNGSATHEKSSAGTTHSGQPAAFLGAVAELPFPCPPHGCKAICGARPHMEDAFTAVPFLLELPISSNNAELIPDRLAGQVRNSHGCLLQASLDSLPESASSLPNHSQRLPSPNRLSAQSSTESTQEGHPEISALHFFGVFDGHGGAEAALLCARTLHDRLAQALLPHPQSAVAERPIIERSSNSHSSTGTTESTNLSDRQVHPPSQHQTEQTQQQQQPHTGAVAACDAIGEDSCSSMDTETQNPVGLLPPQPHVVTRQNFEEAFAEAFSKVDEEFGKSGDGERTQIGSTAVVALVGRRQIYIGNCGDSRAVLCRAGISFPLTDDHKASREDEKKRIQDLGGEVMWWNGERVMGVLAVSRSIGDQYLRPYVIAWPEVTILGRSEEDEMMLLASDGLWDVLSNQEACILAKRCLQRAQQRGASRQTAARVAAAVLTRAAVDKGSSDNVTVVVVDLSPEDPDAIPKAESFGNDGAEHVMSATSTAQLTKPSHRPSRASLPASVNAPQSGAAGGSFGSVPPPNHAGSTCLTPIERAAAIAVAAVDCPSASKFSTNARNGKLQGQN